MVEEFFERLKQHLKTRQFEDTLENAVRMASSASVVSMLPKFRVMA